MTSVDKIFITSLGEASKFFDESVETTCFKLFMTGSTIVSLYLRGMFRGV